MQPSQSEIFRRRKDDDGNRRPQWSLDIPPMSRSASNSQRPRSEGKSYNLYLCLSTASSLGLHASCKMYSCTFYTDSWIEISSQPSSSSLSSAGDQEIITTGLVQDTSDRRRRRQRRTPATPSSRLKLEDRPASAAGSSQDEYEESESESDRVLSSSNEEIEMKTASVQPDDDEDETSTALGIGSTDRTIFTPQPNAFSHPPSSLGSRTTSAAVAVENPYFPLHSATASTSHRQQTVRSTSQRTNSSPRPRASQVHSTQASHTPYNVIAPSHSYQPDHDAALRASLSTLLSCAAAVRGSPKMDDALQPPTASQTQPSNQPTSFRMVSEAQVFGSSGQATSSKPATLHKARQPLSASSGSMPSSPKQVAKRKAREQSKERHSKKSRSATRADEEMYISPTLMSWMISAGVVLVFSAISFSAGYAWGKEVGRFEGVSSTGPDGVSCGREAMKSTTGLRRLRWTSASGTARA